MKVLLFGATDRIGQGALREGLLETELEHVLAVGRSSTGQQHAQLREIVHADLLELAPIEGELAGWDACLFFPGVPSAGMSEEDYTRVTATEKVAKAMLRVASDGAPKPVLETRDINALAAGAAK